MEIIINAISCKSNTRNVIAQMYRNLIAEEQTRGKTIHDWEKINSAIINRWSHSALEYIKNLAWSNKPITIRRK